MLEPPFGYIGGKRRIAHWIISFFPRHTCYAEVFGGGAAVLLASPRSKVEVYNDLNGDIVNFFKVLREQPNELIARLMLTPYSRSEYRRLLKAWRIAAPVDPLERAQVWFTLQDQSFSSKFNSGFSASKVRNDADAWASRPGRLYEVAGRFRGVIIENLDFAELIARYDSPDTLFYIDPPYMETSSDYYPGFRLAEADHRRLAEVLNAVKGHVALSYYDHPLLQELYSNWNREAVRLAKGAAWYDGMCRREEAEELLLMNFKNQQKTLEGA